MGSSTRGGSVTEAGVPFACKAGGGNLKELEAVVGSTGFSWPVDLDAREKLRAWRMVTSDDSSPAGGLGEKGKGLAGAGDLEGVGRTVVALEQRSGGCGSGELVTVGNRTISGEAMWVEKCLAR